MLKYLQHAKHLTLQSCKVQSNPLHDNCKACCPLSSAALCFRPSRRILASWALWHFWHSAARFSRLAASGRWSNTCAAVSTTFPPVTGCGLPFSAPHHSQRLFALTKRTNRLRSCQSAGYRAFISGRIGTASNPALQARSHAMMPREPS